MRHLSALVLGMLLIGCDNHDRSGDTPVTATTFPASASAAFPHFALAADEMPVMSWLEPGQDGHELNYSVMIDDNWSDPVTVAQGDAWFVNWADFPSVVPVTGRLWAAHWLVKKPGGTYAYDIAVSISSDGGTSWSAPIAPHDDGTPTEHGFVTLFSVGDAIGAVWLDGREMTTDDSQAHENGMSNMTLRYARISDKGTITDTAVIDERACDCCATDVAISNNGPVLVYRDRSSSEIRDIAVSRLLHDGWSQPSTVASDQWQIAGCPVNGPGIAASENNVVVAWFTAADNRPRIRVAHSDDSGASFSDAIDLDTGEVIGRVDVELIDDRAFVSWIARQEDKAVVIVQKVSPNLAAGGRKVVGMIDPGRRSGFPQMIRTADQKLLFAWTETGDPSTLKTSVIDPEDI